jgi:general secretion pathway protein K
MNGVVRATGHAARLLYHATRAMPRREQGFALLIVLLTLGFLALLGTQLVTEGRADTWLADNEKQAAELQAAADGAVTQVMFAIEAVHDPRFQIGGPPQVVRIGTTAVLVQVQNEADRVNLNTASLALLRALIIDVGTPPIIADHLAAAILDWRTAGSDPRPNGAKAAQYSAAGLGYGPPDAPFRSVQELRLVLGMTPGLYARLAPHLTVLTGADPDLSTHDAVVARALSDAIGVGDVATVAVPDEDDVLRLIATAIGTGGARYAVQVVATADFASASPVVRILSRAHVPSIGESPVIGPGA